MTRSVVFAAALAGLLAAPVFAEEVAPENVTTGVVSGYAGWLNAGLDNPGYDLTSAEAYLVGGDGFLNHWFSGNVALQLDGYAEASGPLDFEPGYDPTTGLWLAGAAHLAYRDPGSYAVAAFGSLQSVRYTTGDFSASVPYAVVGAEGQLYVDDVTLYLQGGAAFGLDAEPDFTGGAQFLRDYGTFVFVRGVLRYFPTDNVRLAVEGLYGVGTIGQWEFLGPDTYGGADIPTSIASFKLQADYRPDDSDISYFAFYQGSLNLQDYADVQRSSFDQRIAVGLKLDIGADTLKTRDRQGVTWDVPNIGGIIGQAEQTRYCFNGECSDAVPPDGGGAPD